MNILVVGKLRTGATTVSKFIQKSITSSTEYYLDPNNIEFFYHSCFEKKISNIVKINFGQWVTKLEQLQTVVNNEHLLKFDKIIYVVRDIRDELIDKMLYQVYLNKQNISNQQITTWLEILQQKKQSPQDITFIDLFKYIEEIFGIDFEKKSNNIITNSVKYLDFIQDNKSFILKYEDFHANNLAKLNNYLDFKLINSEIKYDFNQWKQFFTVKDIEHFKPLLSEILIKSDYTDWQLESCTNINSDNYSGYVKQLVQHIDTIDENPLLQLHVAQNVAYKPETNIQPIQATSHIGRIVEIIFTDELEDQLYGYSIGNPTVDELFYADSLKIWGWVVGRTSIAEKIEITVENCQNSLLLKTVPIDITRPDVAKQFPIYLDEVGFETTLNITALPTNVRLGITIIFADKTKLKLANISLFHQEFPLPSQSETKPKIIFIHIPKTAGTSLRQIVKREYSPTESLYLYEELLTNLRKPSYTSQAMQANVITAKVIYGHFGFGMHTTLNIPAIYICILRNPIDRVVSYYNHVANNPYEAKIYNKIQNGMSLLEMLQQKVSDQTSNLMTRMIAGEMKKDFSEQQILDEAIANINKYFYFIGLTEKFPASVEILSQKLGWNQHKIPRSNVNANKIIQDIDPQTRAAIEEHNHLDILLYNYINELEGGYFLNKKLVQLFD